MKNREQIIRNYIDGYNQFDIDRMVADFDKHIVFENIQNGTTNLSLQGLDAFLKQAEEAKAWFSERKQTIQSIEHTGKTTEIQIAYHAVLAKDFPNGLKKGQELNLTGKSVFEFEGDKITRLTDIS